MMFRLDHVHFSESMLAHLRVYFGINPSGVGLGFWIVDPA